MKSIPLTVAEIAELHPTSVATVRECRTVVGGLELRGEYDDEQVPALVRKHFGSDCAAWETEPEEGDGCLHVIVYAKL